VLQRVAACCSVLQRVAACCSVKPSTSAITRVSFLHFSHMKTCTKTHTPQCIAAWCSMLQRVASVFHCAALHKCNDTSLCSSFFPAALSLMSFEIQKKKRNSFFCFVNVSLCTHRGRDYKIEIPVSHDATTSVQPRGYTNISNASSKNITLSKLLLV